MAEETLAETTVPSVPASLPVSSKKLNPSLLELCSGTATVSKAFSNSGWQVTAIDNNPKACYTILCDVRAWSPDKYYDFIWASPPCEQFSVEHKRPINPDLSVYQAIKRIISQVKPEYYLIENVRGALPYFGYNAQHIGLRYFWTNLPPLTATKTNKNFNLNYLGRSQIPDNIIQNVLNLITLQTKML